MDSEDGQVFVKNLAYFVRTHERALANALQLQRQRNKNGPASQASASASATATSSSATITLADALSRPYLSFAAHNVKPAKLTLTPHHLYYLLTKFEDHLDVDVGPMNVRLENLNTNAVPSNYVSFLGHAPKSRGRQSDADSLKSVSSVRSVMSSMSSMWSALSLSNSAAKAEKQMAQHRDDIRYLYSCFTKIPALRLSPDHRARLVSGYEEFPFDSAVPLFIFKNLGALEICDLDFRQFFGWDRLAEQVRSLTVRRANVDDPLDLLLNIVLDDMDKRRRRSSKAPVPTTPSSSGLPWPAASPKSKYSELARSVSTPTSASLVNQRRHSAVGSPQTTGMARLGSGDGKKVTTPKTRQGSNSPTRPNSSRHGSIHRPHRTGTPKLRRSSGSSNSDGHEMSPRQSTLDLASSAMLPSSKWRFLRHLSLAENGLTSLTTASFAPVANTLQSLDLSGNLFSEVPDALASLTHLRALNLSNCMIDGLQSLSRNPLPAITTLNLRSNRLLSLAGIERLFSLERLDVRDNRLHDPTELARLTGIPDIVDLYVVKNPFTKTHSNYRVTIFNLFRASPGHKDVTIDSLGPVYNERKQLVNPAPEPANVPVVRPEPEEEAPEFSPIHYVPEAPAQPTTSTVPESPPTSHGHRRTTSDFGPRQSQRRKKAPRRRIVELSQAENQKQAPPQLELPDPEPVPQLTEIPHRPDSESEEPTTPSATPYRTAPTTQLQGPSSPKRPTLETTFSTPTPVPRIRDASDDDDEPSPVHLPQEVDNNTDLYRQKIESLKNDFGPNWLTALSEDRFSEQRSRNRSFSPSSRTSNAQTIRPEKQTRGVSVSGRTLG